MESVPFQNRRRHRGYRGSASPRSSSRDMEMAPGDLRFCRRLLELPAALGG